MVVLTFVLLFVYGMIGWSLFGEVPPESWGTIGQSMLTLFILLTLENFPTYMADAEQVSPYAPIFFVSYVLMAAFVVFNLLIGIVIGSMERARHIEAERVRPESEALLDRVTKLRDALAELEDDLRQRDRKREATRD